MSKASRDELQSQMAEFLAKGGNVESVEAGKRTLNEREVYAKASGRDDLAERTDDYTDRRMRSAENQEGFHHAYYV